jgi:hypothetical protein
VYRSCDEEEKGRREHRVEVVAGTRRRRGWE